MANSSRVQVKKERSASGWKWNIYLDGLLQEGGFFTRLSALRAANALLADITKADQAAYKEHLIDQSIASEYDQTAITNPYQDEEE